MALYILGADNSKEMDEISEELSQHKFKTIEKEDNYILMKKRRYGNLLIHAVCLVIALWFVGIVLFVNVVYFTYSFLWASPNVLITTETVDDEGNPLEFSNMDEILRKATAIL
ncbi:MAG: hypothetical protein E7Z79_07450 [Methanobrevibacter thaueri]|jgi:hypothetical protein|uniref:Uncharacterized protein n=1 Tax=Methanobrevibacter thaueri TaxID=190975 RepID=A0A8T3V6N4_9EURY|nr:hypothetical protein [Methanobrevibacter thaueri]MBE6502263.1 hypothetical protein [Methanobrevibacter thaueri]